jgi:hypothetical protein
LDAKRGPKVKSTEMRAREFALNVIERMRICGCSCGPEEDEKCDLCELARRLKGNTMSAFRLPRSKADVHPNAS